jgi:hypothetical protein
VQEPHRQKYHHEGGNGVGGDFGFAFVDHMAEGTRCRVTLQHRFVTIQ